MSDDDIRNGVKIVGTIIGVCTGAEVVDSGEGEVGIQYEGFSAFKAYNHISDCQYLYVDLISGKFKVYGKDGEVQSTGKVFK